MQAHVAKAGEQVVQPQAGAEAPRRHPRAPIRGQHERERADQMGRHLEQDAPLARCLAHQVELVLLEVAQAAVDQPRRMRRRAAREVALVHHGGAKAAQRGVARSEEHTSELQSQSNLVCRLLLEKKNYNFHTYLMPILTAHLPNLYIAPSSAD